MAVSASGFKARFSEFSAVSDETVEIYLDDAAEFVNTSAWGDRADVGTYYLAAHLYSTANSATNGGGAGGLVSEKRLGPGAVKYAVPSGIGFSEYGLGSTPYGQRFLAMQAAVMGSRVYGVTA